jgi:hypothetical protein
MLREMQVGSTSSGALEEKNQNVEQLQGLDFFEKSGGKPNSVFEKIHIG